MSMRSTPARPLQLARHLRGATLLEALVTLLVVSFGLLGIAGLLLSGIRANAVSNYRSTAMFQAYEIADRMRSNIAGTRDGAYDRGAGASAACEPTTGSCTPADLARSDLFRWSAQNAALLPIGQGSVTRQNPAGQNCGLVVDQACVYEILIKWDEDKSGTVPTDVECRTSAASPECFVLRFEP
jgi:type IV pilus assembly protein PilV